MGRVSSTPLPLTRRVGHIEAIDNNADNVLPTTALAACSPDPQSIVVAAVGYDLLLRVANWTEKGRKQWLPPAGVGDEGELLCPHTDIAVAWNPITKSVEVLATANDASLCLYELREDPRTKGWKATGNRKQLAPAPPVAGRIPQRRSVRRRRPRCRQWSPQSICRPGAELQQERPSADRSTLQLPARICGTRILHQPCRCYA